MAQHIKLLTALLVWLNILLGGKQKQHAMPNVQMGRINRANRLVPLVLSHVDTVRTK